MDGGAKVRAVQRADALAGEAARAGGQAIVLPAAIQGQPTAGRPGRRGARRRRRSWPGAASPGPLPSPTPAAPRRPGHHQRPDRRSCPLIGIADLTVTGHASATLVTARVTGEIARGFTNTEGDRAGNRSVGTVL